MNKKIAVINDLSGFGRCSLTAAIAVLSAMGVQACPFPTAVLSAQTGYPSYYCDDLTDQMPLFLNEWKKMQVHFDGIYTGFVAGEKQIEHIFEFLKYFHREDTFLLVDPVMGDDGEVFDMFSQRLLDLMAELVKKANVITPNLTELCLLTGRDPADVLKIKSGHSMIKAVEEMGREILATGPQTVIVTGIRLYDEADGILKMGNYAVTKESGKLSAFPYIGGSYSGTGDLFASVIAGGIAAGYELDETIKLAGRFIERAIWESEQEQIPYNDGVNFEKYLSVLMK